MTKFTFDDTISFSNYITATELAHMDEMCKSPEKFGFERIAGVTHQELDFGVYRVTAVVKGRTYPIEAIVNYYEGTVLATLPEHALSTK